MNKKEVVRMILECVLHSSYPKDGTCMSLDEVVHAKMLNTFNDLSQVYKDTLKRKLEDYLTKVCKDLEYHALTVQALHMMNEVYLGAVMDKDLFIDTYLNGIGDYEIEVARKEGIEL